MAIGPQHLESQFNEELKELEKKIDDALSKASFTRGKSVWIPTPRPMTDSHFLMIQKLYLNAGWKNVRRDYGDQRDPGDFIIFEA
jgi:hypothetical protein